MRIALITSAFFLCILNVIISCKKDKEPEPAPLPASDPSNMYRAVFDLEKHNSASIQFPSPQTGYSARAYYFDHPEAYPFPFPISSVDAGTVSVEGNNLVKHNLGYIAYFNFENMFTNIQYLPLTISNTGSSQFPATTLTYSGTQFTSLTNLLFPDSIALSSGFNYTLSGTNIPTSYQISISGYDTLGLYTSITGNAINLSAQYLQSKIDTGMYDISLEFKNAAEVKTVNGKHYRANHSTSYFRYGVKFY